jgi:hypothetical protein
MDMFEYGYVLSYIVRERKNNPLQIENIRLLKTG